jgi:hypothetical protein
MGVLARFSAARISKWGLLGGGWRKLFNLGGGALVIEGEEAR